MPAGAQAMTIGLGFRHGRLRSGPAGSAAHTLAAVRRAVAPAGEAAIAVHRGPYNRMNEAYDAIKEWMAANYRESAGRSWEIYGDPTPDPADTETTVVHLLK